MVARSDLVNGIGESRVESRVEGSWERSGRVNKQKMSIRKSFFMGTP